MKETILRIYDTKYKQLLIIPFVILFLSIAVIATHWVSTGDFIKKGVSLQGGSLITVQTTQEVSVADLIEKVRGVLGDEDVQVRLLASVVGKGGFIIETTSLEADKVVAVVKETLSDAAITVETAGPSLGEAFFQQAIFSMLIAFVLMAGVVFFYFRSPIPSSYIVLAAVSDILFAWAMLLALDIRLSTAGVAAFLMLIGYSVDTDILLTTRVLKREGNLFEKIVGAFGTGIVMTLAAMVATGIAYLTSSSEVLKQIMLILFLGLVADIWNTWLQNAGLLRLYIENKHKKAEVRA